MEDMVYKQFMVYAFGDLNDIEYFITRVADKDVNFFSDGKSFAIYNITSTANAHEIKDFLSSDQRSIMVYELDDEKVAMDFQDPNFAKMIFPDTYSKYVNDISVDDSMREYEESQDEEVVAEEEKFNVKSLSSYEAVKEVDRLLDIGLENLSEEQMKTLKILSNMVL